MRAEKKLKIGEVSQLLNIPTYVLRYWEKEFKELRPHKSRSGQRLYSEKDMEVIQRISQLRYKEKLTISGCQARLNNRSKVIEPEVEKNSNEAELKKEIQEIKKGLQEVLDDLR